MALATGQPDAGLVRRTAAGQVGVEMGLALAVLFAVGLTFAQLAGLGVTALKVSHAAQVAAFVAASQDETPRAGQPPCWAVTDGLQEPGAYQDAAICRTIIANLGNLDPNRVTITVAPVAAADRVPQAIQVTVSYSEPITSPLLRWLLGPTFTTTAGASSW